VEQKVAERCGKMAAQEGIFVEINPRHLSDLPPFAAGAPISKSRYANQFCA